MERKIGEIFEYNGEWYQCVGGTCRNCSFYYDTVCKNFITIGSTIIGNCDCTLRTDHKCVIFNKLEKVGEPFSDKYFGLVQKYELEMYSYSTKDKRVCFADGYDVFIKIKQTKEDMEEKKIKLSQDDIDWLKKQIRWAALPGYITHEEDYDRATEEIMNLFIPSDTEHSSSEKIGKNLKPFDLETAKAGKPVCTRDGRKARIICFDFQSIENTPIVAVVQVTDKQEVISHYYEDGRQFVDGISELDLMMLPEKKEGWVNVYKERIYSTKEEAIEATYDGVTYVDTVKVCWEE